MAKKLVQNITAREEDFAQWYTDVVREAKLRRKYGRFRHSKSNL